jgi:membrane protein DedA with SNARE-associated domain
VRLQGALVGDTIGYELGRWGGRPLLERYRHLVHLKPHHLARAEALVARYGTKAVFFGRFIAILRTYSAFLAGVYRLPYPCFLLFNAAGGGPVGPHVWLVGRGLREPVGFCRKFPSLTLSSMLSLSDNR